MVTSRRETFYKVQYKRSNEFKHKNNIVYSGKCPNIICKNDYVGETDIKNIDHNKRDKRSHLL